MKWSAVDLALLILLTLLGTALRFYQLGTVPPGFQFDEAFNAIDAQQVLQGNRPLFLPANAGREVLYTYWQAGLAALFGLNIFSLRLASALAGVVAVPLTFAMVRLLFRRNSRLLASFTALTLAISFWHVHFSHYGIRVILMPVIFSALFSLLWLSQHGPHTRSRLTSIVLSGTLLGASVWTHPTGRLAPFIVVTFLLWTWLRHPRRRGFGADSALGTLLAIGTIAFLVFLPLGLEFYRHPEFFLGHASEVSVFADRVSGDAPWQELARNVVRVLGMFSIQGDHEWTHNLAGRPVFDYAMSIAFVLGALIWLWRLFRHRRDAQGQDPDTDALFLLAVWSAVMLLPSMLSEAAPNYSRTLPALPAVLLATGLGLTTLFQIRRPYRWLGPTLVVLIVAYSSYATIFDYFIVFAARQEAYYLYDADKLDALEYLATLTDDNQVYLSQLWGDKHATVSYLRGAAGIKSLDTAHTLVLPPPGVGAVYAFPSEQSERAEQIAELWNVDSVTMIPDRFGRPLLYVVQIAPENSQEWPPNLVPTTETSAQFDAAPTLVGIAADNPDKQVTLYWLAEERMDRNLTSFVHLIDADGRRVAQVDRLPGNGSYPTTVWSPGERVIDRYFPTLGDPCASGQELQVQVGWYDLLRGSELRPRRDAPGTSTSAGTLVLPYYSYPTADLEPRVYDQLDLAPSLQLTGHAIYTNDPQPGAPFIVDLFWTVFGDNRIDQGELPVQLELIQGDQLFSLWQGQIAPGARWRPGETICRRLRIRIPDDAAPDTYTLRAQVEAPGEQTIWEATFGELQIGPSTRIFEPPRASERVQGRLFEQAGQPAAIELYGLHNITRTPPANRTDVNDILSVDLIWHARTAIQGNYKVFVHLLDERGDIVAQSDALPLGGYTTNRWVAGEYLIDSHDLSLPSTLASGTYRLVVGLYNPVSSQRLIAMDSSDERFLHDAIVAGDIALSEK